MLFMGWIDFSFHGLDSPFGGSPQFAWAGQPSISFHALDISFVFFHELDSTLFHGLDSPHVDFDGLDSPHLFHGLDSPQFSWAG